MLRRLLRLILGGCVLALLVGAGSCGADATKIAARDAALTKLQMPLRLKYWNPATDGYLDTTLSAADSAQLMTAFQDSHPIEWELRSKIEFDINGGQPVQIGVMEQNVFRVWASDDSDTGGYFQSNQDLLGLLKTIGATVSSANTPLNP